MKGLIVKDIKIISKRAKFILLFTLIGVYMAYTASAEFGVGYISMLGVMMSLGTITYDEYNNGYPFLMTFPCTIEEYVREKYILCIASNAVFVLIGTVAISAVKTVTGNGSELGEIPLAALVVFIAVCFVAFISIPVEIKFGGEKSKTALLVLYGIVVIAVAAVGYVIPKSLDIAALIDSIPISAGIIAGIVLGTAVTAISYIISVKEMYKKFV
ncbi:MAG: ABC-2 transporter permease [Oscillospiraceae bacterium]|nr:ABC-2 transporter permease [Oscillospiraceae bacterium]